MRVRPAIMVLVTALRTAFVSAGALAIIAATNRAAPIAKAAGERLRPNAFCTGSGAHSFVGGSDANVAAAADSGVVSGAHNSACGPQTGIGTGGANVAFPTASGAFIAAGQSNTAQTGYSSFIGSGMANSTTASWDAILGGAVNQVTADRGVVLGGLSNTVAELEGFVGGGAHNSVAGGSVGDAVAGGDSNGIGSGFGANFIGGGTQNAISGATSGSTAVIFGGAYNAVSKPSSNTDCSHGAGCQTIGAGRSNQGNNFAATVPGGYANIAGGVASFAAGTRAWAANDNSFVWADDASGAPTLKTSGAYQFLARASGGFYLYTDPANTVGAKLAAGSGTWASISDRALKDHLAPIDAHAVLAALTTLPLAEWSYRSERGVRHMGPMAQDFAAAFGVGEDARHIATLDEAGVALAAIAELDSKAVAVARALRPYIPTCSGKGANAFVGGNDANVAAGQDSGVLTGHKNEACDFDSAVGAGGANAVAATQGGGEDSFIGGGFYSSTNNEPNSITSQFGLGSDDFIGAGNDNSIDSSESGIGGGEHNSVSATNSFLGGGSDNTMSATITDSFLGAGNAGLVEGNYAVMFASEKGPAGISAAGGDYSFIGSGGGVIVPGKFAALGGGEDNTAFGPYSVIAGGFQNRADGDYAVVPGGFQNQANGSFSFAAGRYAIAATNGSFVWSDGSSQITSTVDDQFVAQAVGGYKLYTNAAGTVGATLAPGSGTWASLSDRSVKRDVAPVDPARVLGALRRLPISTWSYRTEPGVRHLGPMAQDFFAAFGVGEDDRHITMIDEDGVVITAVQALAPRVAGILRQAQVTGARLASADRSDRATLEGLRARLIALGGAALLAPRVRPHVPTCGGLGSKAFVGGGIGNVAAATDSGVLSGQDNEACDARSGVGAGAGNAVAGNGGAATDSFIAGGYSNTITGTGQLSFIGAGHMNLVDKTNSAIGAGVQNTNDAIYSTIGAGQGNRIGSADVSSGYDLIGAGLSNTILANYSTIGGGQDNEVFADYAFLGGGESNVIGRVATSAGEYGAIGGGQGNSVQGNYAFLGGGHDNQANGDDSVVPGGAVNVATGTGSFAAGEGSWAAYDGSFVWSDAASGATPLKATAVNQFLARASGGFDLYTDNTMKSGAELPSGSGTWTSLSDRNSKNALTAVNVDAVLARLEELPISTWSYRSEGRVRHIGPMAQDFYRAFRLGPDDKHITTIDEEGVAYAAIQALDARLDRARALTADATVLRTRLRERERTIAALRAQVARFTKTTPARGAPRGSNPAASRA